MNEKLIDILFCLVMFSESIYLWYSRKRLDELLDELDDLLKEGKS